MAKYGEERIKAGGSSPERKRREVRPDVVIVFLLGPLEERNDTIGERCRENLPAALQCVLSEHDQEQVRPRLQAVERKGVKNRRVDQLAAQRRADDPRPQPAPL